MLANHAVRVKCEVHTVVVIPRTRLISVTVPRRCRPPTFSAGTWVIKIRPCRDAMAKGVGS